MSHTASGVAGCGVSMRTRSAASAPRLEVDRRPLDAAATDVDAEPECHGGALPGPGRLRTCGRPGARGGRPPSRLCLRRGRAAARRRGVLRSLGEPSRPDATAPQAEPGTRPGAAPALRLDALRRGLRLRHARRAARRPPTPRWPRSRWPSSGGRRPTARTASARSSSTRAARACRRGRHACRRPGAGPAGGARALRPRRLRPAGGRPAAPRCAAPRPPSSTATSRSTRRRTTRRARAARRGNAALASGCAQRRPAAAHLSTRRGGRDLDRVRAAVGDGLTYLGFSYGTTIGADYSTASRAASARWCSTARSARR